jgi:hypothetical protein
MCPIYRSRKESKIQPGLLRLHVLAETCPTDRKMLDLIEMWLQAPSRRPTRAVEGFMAERRDTFQQGTGSLPVEFGEMRRVIIG